MIMLDEVMTEVREGMEGLFHFQAPSSWKKPAVPVIGVAGFDVLLARPDGRPCVAWAFSVVQEGSDGKPQGAAVPGLSQGLPQRHRPGF